MNVDQRFDGDMVPSGGAGTGADRPGRRMTTEAVGGSAIVAAVVGRIEWVEDRARLAALGAEWDRLAEHEPTPFGDHAWFLAWWDAFSPGPLRTCVLWKGDQLRAVLPLYETRGGLRALANYHTPLFTSPSADEESLNRVVHEAIANAGNELALPGVRSDDELRDALIRASRQEDRLLLSEGLHRSPRVELSGDFSTYAQAQGRTFKDLARRWRKLSRERKPRLRWEEEAEDLEAQLERAYELEASGWKGRRKTAIISSPQTRSFYTSIAHAYHARGELSLIWLDIDDQPAAFSFCLLRAGRLYSLKLGIDERMRPYAPGLMIDYCTIQRCFDRGIECYELLGADEPYKRRFATGWADHVGLHSYRRNPLGLTRYEARRHGRPLLRAARRRLGV